MTEAKAKARWNLAQWVVIAVRAISLFGAFMPHPAPPVAPAGATAEIHYAPDENLEPIDVAEIDRARKTIDILAYVLTDNAIIDALARGPAWRRPQDPARSRDWRNGRATTILSPGLGETPEGIQIRTKAAGGALMHLKGYCVDGLVLRAGSANFSRSDETQRDNDLVIARGKVARAKFEAKFAKAWEWSK